MSERMKTMNIYEISIRPHAQMLLRAAIVAMILTVVGTAGAGFMGLMMLAFTDYCPPETCHLDAGVTAIMTGLGVAALIARHKALTCSFNYLSRVSSDENNFWEGYVTRTVRESLNGRRAARMVYEHIQGNRGAIFHTARRGGMTERADLHPFHARLLNLDVPFR